MKQFGIPTCPYCGKHVNLVRMWTLKRDGEYVCPYCGGISNVRHSPLMNFFAVICAIIAFVIFAFTRFFLGGETFMTCVYVFLPFAVFFVCSMFLVQLVEPVVRQGKRESAEARRDAAVMRRRQREAVAAAGNTSVSRTASSTVRRPAAQPKPAAPKEPTGQTYTDISSHSGRFVSPQRTQQQTAQRTSRDIYSSSRGQGYSYSTSAYLRTQDEEAAEARRRKIEMLKRLQQEQNQEYQSSKNSDKNGQ